MKNRWTQLILGVVLAGSLVACTAMTGESAGRNIDDANITAAVKAKLAMEHATTLTSIDVDTVKGTVYLTGTVPDFAAKQKAGEIAYNVSGVNRVVNNLQARSAAGDAPHAQ
ncbi:MAG TPA: BON domain-containing protein [Burkholderiales bacterium]|nr:BON domain-containing protein [Burkholderiales bacterium]